MIKLRCTPLYLFCFLGLFLVGCSEKPEGDSGVNNIIPEKEFTEILAECQLAEAQLTVARVLQPIYKDSILNYYAGIFDTYNISTSQFKESLKFYTKDPIKMDTIYANVLQILQKKSDDLGPIEIPKNNLSAISRVQLGDIIHQTPFADSILLDSNYNTTQIRESLMAYIDSNLYLIDTVKINRPSFEFSFVINSSNKIMYNELQDYLLTLKNKEVK